jgi:hypothetical protein
MKQCKVPDFNCYMPRWSLSEQLMGPVYATALVCPHPPKITQWEAKRQKRQLMDYWYFL